MNATLYTDAIIYLSTRNSYMQEELRKQGKCPCQTCIDVAYAESERRYWLERQSI